MAAEVAVEQFIPDVYTEQAIVLVEAVPEMLEDRFTRQRAAHFIGTCLAENDVRLDLVPEASSQANPIDSLYDAIRLAAERNDSDARRLIETNVATDVIERTIKAGHVIKVDLNVDDAGRIQQFGQSMESVQANSLRQTETRSPQMMERTKAEALNTFRIDSLYRQGVLEDYNFVVFSRAADDMDRDEMAEAGFFVETMSCAIQVTTAEDDHLTMESAFVAGVKADGWPRHDAETITTVASRLGVDVAGKSATELIATPLLVHKSLMPNGVIDLVQLYDESAGGTFFGEHKAAEDYVSYRQKCREREELLSPKVQAITNELIAEAPTIHSRAQATRRLHKLSEKHMVQQAVMDNSIDPRVFGPAAEHINAARIFFEQGHIEEALRSTRQAERTAVSSSCPNGSQRDAEQGQEGDSQSSTSASEEVGDCDFISKECPKCHKKNVRTVISKGKISGSCGCTAKLK
jgi:hypothetical protein